MKQNSMNMSFKTYLYNLPSKFKRAIYRRYIKYIFYPSLSKDNFVTCSNLQHSNIKLSFETQYGNSISLFDIKITTTTT